MVAAPTLLILISAVVILILTGQFHCRQIKETKGITDTKDRVDARTEIVKTTAQMVAGVTVLTGLLISWYQFQESRTQFAKSLERQTAQLDLSRAQFELAQIAQLSKSLETAVTHLGSDKPSIRTGGVYAVVKLAQQEPEPYLVTGRELIESFLQGEATEARFEKLPHPDHPWPSGDIRAAIRALVLLQGDDPADRAELRGLFLETGNLRGESLAGLVLPKCRLFRAEMQRIDVRSAVFDGADMRSAKLNGADLSDAHFVNADLSGADLFSSTCRGSVFEDAIFHGARLSVANFNGAVLWGAKFQGAQMLGTVLTGADLKNADLSGAQFLTQGQIELAIGNTKTKLPATLTTPESWK